MAIKLNVSNSLENLLKNLGTRIQSTKGNVFVPEYIVTQTDGMNIWMKNKLAKQLGIVANIDFKKPNDLIFRLYLLLKGPFYTTISRENLVWLLYRLMGENDFIKRYPIQAAYFDVTGIERDLKRMGLAERMADLFDQYQIFRPEMIQEWNQESLDTPTLSWQTFLWIKTKQLAESKMPDKTVISQFIFSQLKDEQQIIELKKKLPSVYLFGLSILTRYHLDIFAALSEVIDVHFYLLNPAPDIYWMDDKSEKDIVRWKQKGAQHTDTHIIGNPLLTRWGKVLQNTYRLLFKNEALLNNYEILAPEEPQPTNLLSKIQWDVYNNAVEGRQVLTYTDLKDTSIVIQSCYTIAREVDALYQYLVHLVDRQKVKLSAQDIVVMVSDIDSYAPYIKATFDNAPYKFKFKIADVSIAVGDNMVTALQQLLLLNEDNFTSETVMQLLDSSIIRQRFQLTDIDALRNYVSAANIKFGIDGRKDDETYLVSWQYGLKRLMYGICMSGEGLLETENESLYPLDIVEGAASLELIRFVHFVETLILTIKSRKNDRSITGWKAYVEYVIQDMLWSSEENPTEEYIQILNQLNTVNQLEDIMKETVPFEIFRKHMLESLSNQTNESLFSNGGITFCSFIPMRSIPFKVVCMLGMDQTNFPRKEQSSNFNLIQQKHMLGDRNIKDNDKHLFLETVLSAQEYLYISYLGKSLKDNTDLPSSILVDELLDYIQSGIKEDIDIKKVMVIQHPLHDFSQKYNQANDTLYRYATSTPSILKQLLKTEEQQTEQDFSEIALKNVIDFCKHSIKSFYNKRLGIYYDETSMVLDETEIFELNHLQQWNLKQGILYKEEDITLTEVRDQWTMQGLLPLKNAADIHLETLKESMEPFIEIIHQEKGKLTQETRLIEIQFNDTILSGRLQHIYGNKYISVCTSSAHLRYMIETYLNVLAGIASHNITSAVFIYGKNEPQAVSLDIRSIHPEEAKNRLEQIIALYKNGLTEIYPFVEVLYKNIRQDIEYPHNIIENLIDKAIHDYTAPNTDPYIENTYALGYFREQNLLSKYYEVFNLVIQPLYDVFKGVKF